MKLSIIIIAKDAKATIRRCPESVKWADEIVVHAPFGLAALLALAARHACARPVA